MFKKRTPAVMALAVLISLNGCTTASQLTKLAENNSPKVLHVGIAPDVEPICFKENNEIVGIEPDFAKLMAQELKMELKLVELPRDILVDAVTKGSVDIIMSGLAVTDLRRTRVDFSFPYLNVGDMAVMRHENSSKYRYNIDILNVKGSVGVVKGTSTAKLAPGAFKDAKVKTYGTPEKALQAIIKKRCDLAIVYAPHFWTFAAKNEEAPIQMKPWRLNTQKLAWAVSKNDPQLLALVNEKFRKWSKNGTLMKIITRRMPYVRRSSGP